mmetsp:Transcript_14573/g.28208  ORF Transcript_14573/g.28208 Transcript_14573/m.28208 type:complete len:279 (+) Transcript_14573:540-1376(+)
MHPLLMNAFVAEIIWSKDVSNAGMVNVSRAAVMLPIATSWPRERPIIARIMAVALGARCKGAPVPLVVGLINVLHMVAESAASIQDVSMLQSVAICVAVMVVVRSVMFQDVKTMLVANHIIVLCTRAGRRWHYPTQPHKLYPMVQLKHGQSLRFLVFLCHRHCSHKVPHPSLLALCPLSILSKDETFLNHNKMSSMGLPLPLPQLLPRLHQLEDITLLSLVNNTTFNISLSTDRTVCIFRDPLLLLFSKTRVRNDLHRPGRAPHIREPHHQSTKQSIS